MKYFELFSNARLRFVSETVNIDNVFFRVFSLYVISFVLKISSTIVLIDKLWLYGFNTVLMEQVVLSPNGLFMLHQITLLFKNVSVEFSQVSCFIILWIILKHGVHFRSALF